jgi:hypothetical protein
MHSFIFEDFLDILNYFKVAEHSSWDPTNLRRYLVRKIGGKKEQNLQ